MEHTMKLRCKANYYNERRQFRAVKGEVVDVSEPLGEFLLRDEPSTWANDVIEEAPADEAEEEPAADEPTADEAPGAPPEEPTADEPPPAPARRKSTQAKTRG